MQIDELDREDGQMPAEREPERCAERDGRREREPREAHGAQHGGGARRHAPPLTREADRADEQKPRERRAEQQRGGANNTGAAHANAAASSSVPSVRHAWIAVALATGAAIRMPAATDMI